jgi:hypothetical protein
MHTCKTLNYWISEVEKAELKGDYFTAARYHYYVIIMIQYNIEVCDDKIIKQSFINILYKYKLYLQKLLNSYVNVDILKAIELIKKNNYIDAACYFELGINTMENNIKKLDKSNNLYKIYLNILLNNKLYFDDLVNFIDKNNIKDETNKIKISNNDKNRDFLTVFKKCFTPKCTIITIQDAYFISPGQCKNLKEFCKISIQNCKNLKQINIITTKTHNINLNKLKKINKKIKIIISINDLMHDRVIKFNNGYKILLGRGLDYFKHSESDYPNRSCKETNIIICFEKNKSNDVFKSDIDIFTSMEMINSICE